MNKTNDVKLTNLERSQLLRFGVALDILCEPYADQRFAMLKYGKRDLGMIRKKAATLLADVLEQTVPKEQIRQLQQHMRHAGVEIGVKRTASVQHDREYGAFLSNIAMQALADASTEKCRLCMLNKHDAKKCALRGALDEMWIQGTTGTENDCPYYQL